MATYTTNLNLKKPALDDDALITDINSNMDTLDTAVTADRSSLDALRDGLAIVSDGDTHIAITAGQWVYVKGHNTLPEGLYTAQSNIAANGALSTSNLTADSNGGLNALSDQIGTLNGKINLPIAYISKLVDTNGDADTPNGIFCAGANLPHGPTLYPAIITIPYGSANNYGVQIGMDVTNSTYLYVRIKIDGVWQAWRRIATEAMP